MKNEAQVKYAFDKANGAELIGDIYDSIPAPIVTIYIDDTEHNDFYRIVLQKTNFGVGGLCFLNNVSSYQADFKNGKEMSLACVINKIAGGEVMRESS